MLLRTRLTGPCRFPARRDLGAAFSSHQTKIRRSAESPLRRPVLDGVEETTVRSVRTRRSTRSSRGGTARNMVQGSRNGLDRKKRPECRVTVNHSASPSRRESARRAIKCFQSQPAITEHPLVRRCAAAYLSLSSSTRSRASRSRSLHRWQASHLLFEARLTRARAGKSDTELPLSYCYESPTQLRLESVAYAHTAADLHVRS
jgi:hypothetical protein